MRPQHITAENQLEAAVARGKIPRFNEAAAYHCGKRGYAGSLESVTLPLQ